MNQFAIFAGRLSIKDNIVRKATLLRAERVKFTLLNMLVLLSQIATMRILESRLIAVIHSIGHKMQRFSIACYSVNPIGQVASSMSNIAVQP
ncbi:hypothetical protein YQE_03661, partial [Dendroctonus ponderosae]